MNWNRKLSELEMRAFCSFVMNQQNGCKVVAEKDDPTFKGEGLRQTLYFFENSDEYIFVVEQKGYVVNVLHIGADEIAEFKTLWDQGMLTPYGHAKEENVDYGKKPSL